MMGRDIICEIILEIFNIKDKDIWNVVLMVFKDY